MERLYQPKPKKMLFFTTIKVSIKSLIANKLRSFLAMLGIIIGVAAVIAMLALGTGAQKQIMERLSKIGKNLLILRPGQRGSRGVMSGAYQNLTIDDAESIINNIPDILQVAPLVRSNAQIKYFNKNTRSNVLGTTITYLPVRNFQIEMGRSITEAEVENSARVALIGSAVVENLFDRIDPLEKVIKIKGINFKIIGILKSKGDQGWYNPDNQIIVSYKTAMKQLFGKTSLSEVGIQVSDNADMDKVNYNITRLIRRRHRIQQEMPDDFYIRNMAEIQETYASVSKTFTFLLGGIAYISLLVGGIGIMNIMLVTVTERIKEIGIRKAVGAKEKDILLQFLFESLLITGIGGFAGILTGAIISSAINQLTGFKCIIEPVSILLALAFSASIGIFFGYYPARCAAKLNPIDALRYE